MLINDGFVSNNINNQLSSSVKILFNINFLFLFQGCIVGTPRNTPNNSVTNYRREMTLIPINMDHSLLQLEAIKTF